MTTLDNLDMQNVCSTPPIVITPIDMAWYRHLTLPNTNHHLFCAASDTQVKLFLNRILRHFEKNDKRNIINETCLIKQKKVICEMIKKKLYDSLSEFYRGNGTENDLFEHEIEFKHAFDVYIKDKFIN